MINKIKHEFEHTKLMFNSTNVWLRSHQLNQNHIEHLTQFLIHYENCLETSKFDVGKIKVELILSLKTTAVFKKQFATQSPLQLQDKVQQLLGILTYFDIIAPVNADSLTTGNIFSNPVIFLENWNSLKIVEMPVI